MTYIYKTTRVVFFDDHAVIDDDIIVYHQAGTSSLLWQVSVIKEYLPREVYLMTSEGEFLMREPLEEE